MSTRVNFYDLLIELSEYTVRASDMLKRSLVEFQYENIKYLVVEIHEIENDADKVYHKIQREVEKQYILPLNKEDILQLGHTIDSVIDTIEDILMAIYMYDIKEITPSIYSFVDIIVDASNSIVLLVNSLKTAKKYSDIEDLIKHIRNLEDRADKVYIESTQNIFLKLDSKNILKNNKLSLKLESCVDTCQHVADTVANIFLKNV